MTEPANETTPIQVVDMDTEPVLDQTPTSGWALVERSHRRRFRFTDVALAILAGFVGLAAFGFCGLILWEAIS